MTNSGAGNHCHTEWLAIIHNKNENELGLD